jgi:competence protein ComEC
MVILPLLLLLFLPVSLSAQIITGNLQTHFIEVGQGDAILVVSPKRECVMLIDSGDSRYPGSAKNFKAYIQNKLPLGSRIDLAVASHPHADHVGSMLWVLRNYRVGTYIDNGVQYDSATYRKLQAELKVQVRQRQLRYIPHDQATLEDQDFCRAGNLNSKVLVPSRGYQRQFCDTNPNNCSVIVRMTYDAVSFLFPGDAEQEQEAMLLEHPELKQSLSAKVLKVSHHGSDTSSTRAFLDAVSPEWMVISAGKKNVGTNKSFMHPRLATINNLMTFAGAHSNPRYVDVYDSARKVWARKSIWGNLFVTGKDGRVVLSSDGSQIRKH